MNNQENSLPEYMKFKGTWRSYQQAFLDDINLHLSDRKLNVVAAPGSGKTTLGIEIIKRLNHPALILSPTITIRNQWKQRIIDAFLPKNTDTDWISTNAKNIKTITSTTYQSVHSIIKNPQENSNFIDELKNNKIKTIVLDEAHHLRTEWYNSLDYLCSELEDKDFRIVSLTATPPYDVCKNEWENYHNLCGPVDAEISIPELVQNKDLCPHQDIIWFSNLDEEESKIVYDFEQNRKSFFDYINTSPDLSYAVKTSKFIQDYESNIELIYDDTNFTISLISYLLSIDNLNIEAKIFTEFLSLEKENIPPFNYDTAEILFNGMLGKYKKHFKNIPLLKSKLKEAGLLKSSTTVDFKGETDFKKLYAESASKLKSINEIIRLESELQNEKLRAVVLLDYIGAQTTRKLTVLSVFNKILELNITQKTGILTGSMVVIPKSSKPALYELLEKYNIDKSNIITTDFKTNHLRVETYNSINPVNIITELFKIGEINILVGTQSLLGEGWDAPCLNTLIIASSVGSFMLSNQIRGRALRIDKSNPQKTSNIWHLVTLSANREEDDFDMKVIEKRFATFEGISYIDEKIQNETARLGYNSSYFLTCDTESLNKHSIELMKNRNKLAQKWQQSFQESAISENKIRPQVYETIQTPEIKLPQICYIKNLKNPIYKYFRNIIGNFYLKHSQKELLQIINALLKTMCETSAIMTPYSKISIQNKIIYNSQDKISDVYITILNCTNYERNLFVKTMTEMFSEPDNQRYLLKKTNPKTQETKYITVPEILGTKKKNVKIFEKNLEPVLGYLDIIFTRNPDGRKELLKSKFNTIKLSKIKRSKIWI